LTTGSTPTPDTGIGYGYVRDLVAGLFLIFGGLMVAVGMIRYRWMLVAAKRR
jgi:hypothetical protein